MLRDNALKFGVLAREDFISVLELQYLVSELGGLVQCIGSFRKQSSYMHEACLKSIVVEKLFNALFVQLVLRLSERSLQLISWLLKR